MPIPYDYYYDSIELLNQENPSLEPPRLWDVDSRKAFAKAQLRLAQPLPDGSISPFSGSSPLSGEGQLLSLIVYYLDLLGHQINLIPSRTFKHIFALHGVTIQGAEYPILQLRFVRSASATRSGQAATIPLGQKIYSRLDPDVYVLTTQSASIEGDEAEVFVNARLNQRGKLRRNPQPGEFSRLSPSIPFIDNVTNTDIAYDGKDEDDFDVLVDRWRRNLQRVDRISTVGDIASVAKDVGGATTVSVLERIKPGTTSSYQDLTTVAVYPADTVPSVESALLERAPIGGITLNVIEAEIVLVSGTISARIDPNMSDGEAFNSAAIAIRDYFNPPYGKWGNQDINGTLVSVLKRYATGINLITDISLVEAESGVDVELLTIEPWQLVSIQNTIRFIWLR